MGIGHQLCSLTGQFPAKIAPLKTCKPQFIRSHCRVWTSNHLKFQIGENFVEWHRRMREKILIPLPARLLAAKEDKDYGSLGAVFVDQEARQLQDCNAAGSVVVCAVVDAVSVHRLADSQV